MAWLEAHQELRDHPKTKRAARTLGISRPQMIGHLLCLWWWCLDYAETGSLADFDNNDIADAAAWEGDPDTFVSALLNCGPADRPGFLIDTGDGLTVNDWDEYGGKYVTKRTQGRERQRTYRQRNAVVTRDSSVSNTPREDKIIEDEIRQDERIEVSAPTAAPPPKPARVVTPGSQSDMFVAIAETCQLDAKLKAGQIAKQSKALLEAGYTPAQVRAFPVWWQLHDWRGQRGNVPTLAQLAELIKQSTTQTNGSDPVKVQRGAWSQADRQSEEYKRKMDALIGD